MRPTNPHFTSNINTKPKTSLLITKLTKFKKTPPKNPHKITHKSQINYSISSDLNSRCALGSSVDVDMQQPGARVWRPGACVRLGRGWGAGRSTPPSLKERRRPEVDEWGAHRCVGYGTVTLQRRWRWMDRCRSANDGRGEYSINN